MSIITNDVIQPNGTVVRTNTNTIVQTITFTQAQYLALPAQIQSQITALQAVLATVQATINQLPSPAPVITPNP